MAANKTGRRSAGRDPASKSYVPLIEDVIDREHLRMPPWYVPAAPGVVIAGGVMLSAAGYRPHCRRPHGWRNHSYDHFSRWRADRVLRVIACDKSLAILREQFDDPPSTYTLTCAFSGRPIWTRTYSAAMWLCEHCDPIPQAPIAGQWVRFRD
jgi:hypothetical protein